MLRWYSKCSFNKFSIYKEGKNEVEVDIKSLVSSMLEKSSFTEGKEKEVFEPYIKLIPELVLQGQLKIDLKKAEMVKELGEGTYAVAKLANYEGRKVVVKLLRPKEESQAFDEFVTECWMMSVLKHKNIVKLEALSFNPLAFVLEYMNCGDLRKYLDENKRKHINWDTRMQMLIDISIGMNFAHNQWPPIIHRDLKTPNVFLNIDSNGTICAKIADLGLSSIALKALRTEGVDNPAWSAREILLSEDCTEKVDVYSFAIMMWEILTTLFPFEEERQYFSFSFQLAEVTLFHQI